MAQCYRDAARISSLKVQGTKLHMQALSRATHRCTSCCATVVGLILIVALSACNTKPQQVDLRARIAAAKTEQYCQSPNACFNPGILVLENGYDVTTFLVNKPKHETIRPGALASYLVSLPMTAWPQGPSILITPSDDVIDGKAIEGNLKEAQRICHSLNLRVEFRPGG